MSDDTNKPSSPSSPSEWFQLVQDITDKLTIKRIATILLTGILITGTTMFYENRAQIFEETYHAVTGNETVPGNWEVSDQTKADLTTLVNNTEIINLVSISQIDLQKNRRHPLWAYTQLPNSDEINQKLSMALPRPVFDYDPKNTQQMISVLNNEFVCSRTQDTIWRFNFPDIYKKMPVVCRIAIPPFYGRLVGVLSFGLNRQPTKEEVEQLRVEAARLAVDVYLRDVVRKPIPKD